MAEFWKMTPGGNPTVLLRAEDVAKEKRVEVAREILSPLHLGGEQAGFVRLHPQPKGGERTRNDLPRLDMTGGEFCLNATRAFGALLAWQGLLPLAHKTGAYQGMVEVSGADTPVLVEVSLPNEENSTCYASACLNFQILPKAERREKIALLRLPGICHIIMEEECPKESELNGVCAQLRQTWELTQEEAVGCMWLGRDAQGPFLYPAVWVRDTQSLCLESACGSGTLACALWLAEQALAYKATETQFSIRQPSGDTLHVEIQKNESGFAVRVGGPVRLVAQGELIINGHGHCQSQPLVF